MSLNKKGLKLRHSSFVSIIIYITLFFGILHDTLGLPGLILFFNDFLLVLGVIFSGKKIIKNNRESLIYLLFFLLYTFITYISNYQSIFYYLYGVRNYFRYYVFFLLTATTFKEKDIVSKLDFFDRFFYANCVVMLIQYYFFGLEQDHLGGFFGTSYGCNGSLNVLFVIITAKSLVYTLDNKETLKSCIIKCGLCILLSAYAELKVYYFEFIVILLFVFIMTGFSFKKLFIVITSIIGVIVGVYLLVSLFPGFAGFFTYEGVMRIIGTGSYSDSNAFNRLTFVNYFNRRVLVSKSLRLFGLGLGNCDTSSIGLFATRFYDAYGWTHYDWFSAPFLYLETGLFGIAFYIGFFVLCGLRTLQLALRKQIPYTICRLVTFTCIISFLLFIYNQSMRTEAAFLIYFVLAIPFSIKLHSSVERKK